MIRIVKGVYGFVNKNGTVSPKTEKSEPFELSEQQESRLVAQGVAVYVNGGRTAMPEGVEEVPNYNVNMKAEELRAIAKKYMGLTFKFGTSKAEMVAVMDKHIAEHSVSEVEI